MNNQFSTHQLGEVADIIAGGDRPKIFSLQKSSAVYVPVIANAEKNNGLLGYTDTPRIVEPAVTLAARGSNVGFAAIRKEPFFPVVRVLSLIPDQECLDVDYLFYNLKQNRKKGTGSGQPQITIPDISSKTISLPPISVQKKVAKVLVTLDQKIELNNRINAELEAMAKTLYDYWFVQFDFPDENGKPYKSSGGKMVYNEILKRKIPEGWSDKELSEVVSRIGTGLNPRQHFKLGNGSNYYVTIKNIEDGKVCIDDKCDRIDDNAMKRINTRSDLREGDILFTSIEPVGTTYLIQEKPKNWNINESVFTIRPNYDVVTSEFLYLLLSGKEMKAFTKNVSAGSIHKGVRIGVLNTFKLPFLNSDLVSKFTDILKPMLKKQYAIEQENRQLVELRDWLLPMLMNGQVKVT